jgi:hypothetical protein
MATTPVYNWPTPDDTDLVKDGAKAIRDLGNAIDTTVSSVPTGLIHIETDSFSGSAAVNVDDVFSANFRHYKIELNVQASTTATISLRYRRNASTNSATNSYISQLIQGNGTTVTSGRNTANSAIFTLTTSAGPNFISCTVMNPFLDQQTTLLTNNGFGESTPITTSGLITHIDTSKIQDGFQIFASSGNVTGDYSVYGLKES